MSAVSFPLAAIVPSFLSEHFSDLDCVHRLEFYLLLSCTVAVIECDI